MVGTGHVLDAAAKVGRDPRRAAQHDHVLRRAGRPAHRALAARPEPERRPVHGHEARRVPRRHAPGGGRRPGHLHRHLRWRVRHVAAARAVDGRAELQRPDRARARRRDHRVRRLPDPVGVRGRRRPGVGARHPQGRGGGAVPRLRPARPTSAGCRTSATPRSEIAGSPNRVTEVAVAELDDPEVAARFGPSLVALARKRFPSPFFVNDQTVERLGYEPISLTTVWPAPSPGCASTTCSDAERPRAQKGAVSLV